MKFSNLKVIFLALFSIGCLTTLQSQAECGLPAPPNIWEVETTSNSTEVDWTEIPGASYLVEATDVLTSIVVYSTVTSNNTHIVTGLQPGREYDIDVTTLCDGGAPGGTANIRVHTGIIVVDIVMHLNCDPTPGNPMPHIGSTTYQNGDTAFYAFTPTDVIVLEGDIELTTSTTQFFQVAFRLGAISSYQQIIVGTDATYDGKIQVIPNYNNNGLGMIQHQPSGGSSWIDLAKFRPFAGNGPPRIEVQWKKTVSVDNFRCNTVTFDGDPKPPKGGGNRGGGGGGGEQGLQASPNPTRGLLTVKVAEDTPLEIYDLQGRRWYTTDLQVGDRLNLDATNWPNGTYFIKTIAHDQVVIDRFMKIE